MFAIAFITSLFLLSLVLTGLIRRYAITAKLLDIPNHRSSHTIPTPRGGGLGFVVCFLAALVFLTQFSLIAHSLAWSLGGAGFIVALLGFLDDKISLPARWRLLGHILAGFFALYYIVDDSSSWNLAWAGCVECIIALFYLVWLLNLYNFMDGIDGIAGVETLTVCLSAALMYSLVGERDLIILPVVLASVVAGFLIWNMPRARIFMGDVGSGFLGMILGVLSIYSTFTNPKFLWGWLILLGVFITDASITLLRRAMTGQPIFEAHRSHAYQKAAQLLGTHLPVTVLVGIINTFWLLPIALLTVCSEINGLLGLIIAYLPLVGLTVYLKAGCID